MCGPEQVGHFGHDIRNRTATFATELKLFLSLAFLLVLSSIPLAAQSPVRYLYDDLGRLIKVIDQNGNAATYSYDAVGNILSISRSTVPANSGLAVLGFNPQRGPIGQTVTIQGQGFSTTATSNVVKFNATTAVVSSATATALTVNVPAGTTSGLISVTIGGTTASSGAAFTVTAGALVSIAVSPATASIRTGGQQQQFTAQGTYSDGSQQNITSTVTWSSSNAAIATVSNAVGSQGLATGVGGGTTTITATSGTLNGAAVLTVNPYSSISIAPTAPTILKGGTLQFGATGTFSDGTTQDVTKLVQWTSNNAAAVTISNLPGSQGLAAGVFTGPSFVCAVSAGVNGCTVVTVVPVLVSIAIGPLNQTLPKSITQQFSATGSYNDNTTKDITTTVTWSSSNPAVATISNAASSQGQATDVGIGTTTIQATSGSVSNSTTLTLTAPIPVSLSVTPAVVTLQQSRTSQLSAKIVLSDGTTQDVTPTAAWATSDPTVATVGTSGNFPGLVTAIGPGTATVSATSGSFNNSASVTVGSGAGFPRFLYAGVDGVARYTINAATGQLRSDGYLQGPGGVTALALDPAQKFLYAAGSQFVSGNTSYILSAYAVNSADGSLTPVTGSPYPLAANANVVLTDPSGKFVYAASGSVNNPTGSISGFSIDRATGALTPIPGSPFTTAGAPLAILIHASGKYLFATNYHQNVAATLSVFGIDPTTGVLAEITGSPFPVAYNPIGLAADPAGKFLYVVNHGQDFGSLLHPLQGPMERQAAPQDAKRGEPDFLLRRGTRETPSGGYGPLVASLNLSSAPPTSYEKESDVLLSALPKSPFFFQGAITTAAAMSVFSVDSATGTLAEIPGSPFPLPSQASGVASVFTIDPSGQYGYLALGSFIYGYGIDPANGTPTALPDSPYSATQNLFGLTWDPSGKFAYGQGSDSSGNVVLELGLNASTGTLTTLSRVPVRSLSFALAVSKGSAPATVVPRFAYVASGGGPAGANSVSGYSIDPTTGALSPVAGSPFAEGFSPVFATTDLAGRFLFLANRCSDATCTAAAGSVSAYQIDPVTGALTLASGAPFLAGNVAAGVVVDPSTQFAYVINNQDSTVSIYAIDPVSGALTPLPGSPYATVSNGSAAATIDPVGFRFLVAAKCLACTNGTLYDYGFFSPNIGRWAGLNQQLPLGPSPQSIAASPAGRFAFVTDATSNVVYAFSGVTGFASAVTGSPFATEQNPVSVTVDPSGRFVYVANQASNNLSAYTVDPLTGALAPMSASPYNVGLAPSSVTVDYSGKFVYVTNSGDGTVTAFALDPNTGALTPVPGSPFPVGAAPVSIVTTGKIQ
jgi:YD repeat-containing protein